MRMLLSALNALLGLVLTLTPFWLAPVCSQMAPHGGPMKCYYSGLFVVGMGAVILFFALIALLQSTVSLGGDLLFLRVQAVHPLLFMLSGWLASLVFSFFTYTMVVSFGNVGKAIGVLMLIVQISGANAAYPVQMLPDFIAKVSPLLPLTHAVTMMRAAIAGIYDMDYWRAAGMLLAFVPPLLLLGLLLRKPLVRFNQWYVAQVESTKVLS